ncbi:tRNA methyltransferase, has a role in tRNA modification [Myotisia sp. PD_48]|nr:tRNA methyltransferase, has a role in tRNA modification [Myotisia sp. PD_48]
MATSDVPAESPEQRGGEAYEEEHVHQVYEDIASHFSSTRYKVGDGLKFVNLMWINPWPIVERFLNDLSPGSIGLDIGCGNGKYLKVNSDIFIVASDRSQALATIASQHHPHSAIIADNLNLPHRDGKFDFAISIAVVHHLSLPERRVKAIASILETLRQPCPTDPVGGKALIYVWALEQKASRRGWDAGDDQDVMVPWVLQGSKNTNKPAKGKKKNCEDSTTSSKRTSNLGGESCQDSTIPSDLATPSSTTYLRYYHLYKKDELEADVVAANGRVLDHGYEKDNWWVIASPVSRS